MRFLSFSTAFVFLAAAAAGAGGCQSPDKFLRDGGMSTFTGNGGRGGGGGSSFTGSGGGSGGNSSTGKGGGGGSTFTGNGGTTGSGGSAGGAGGGGTGPMPCDACDIRVEYKCRNADVTAANQQISFVLRLVNSVGTAVPLSNITIRYWFTANGRSPAVNCDYAHIKGQPVNCSNIAPDPPATPISTFKPVSPALPKADTYLEIAFNSTAGTLDAFHSEMQEDQIQLRIHDVSFQTMSQTDDYSFDCSMLNTEIESPLITAYIGGVLKFGTEPGGSSATGTGGTAGGTGGTPGDASASD